MIIKDLHADLALASWIALVYALITASLYLPCGRMADLLGVGKLFLAGFVLYSISSLAAGAAQGAGQLIFFRALQAAGSALIMANNFALVTALFPREERGRAMGIAGGTGVGSRLHPWAGLGWAADPCLRLALKFLSIRFPSHGRFRRCAGALAGGELRKAAAREKEPFDFAGAVSFAIGISSLLFALALAQKGQWRDPIIGLMALSGVGVLGFFVWWEKRARSPLLDLDIFRIAAFSLGNATRWFSFITMSVSNLLMPFFLQLVMGLDPLRAGFLVAPTPLAMALLAPFTGWMSERFVPERLCALGLAVNGAALVFLSFSCARRERNRSDLWLGFARRRHGNISNAEQ